MKPNKFFIVNQEWYFGFLLLIGGMGYILNTSVLGFYWDDWQAVFLYKTHSIQTLLEYFQYDRPFSAYTYIPLFKILPMQSMVWQILTVLIRCTAVWLLTQTFILIWDDHKWALRWFGAIVLVFPSFALQSVSVAFNQHFIALLLFSLSLYLMVKAFLVKTWSRWLYGALSLITAFGHMATMEYFVGLEILRPFLIFAVLTKKGNFSLFRSRALKTVLVLIPYGIILSGYFYWRFILYPFSLASTGIEPPNAPSLLFSIKNNFQQSLIDLLILGLQDSFHLITQSWARPLLPEFIRLDDRFNLLSWGVSLFVALLFALWVHKKHIPFGIMNKSHFHRLTAIIGCAGIVLGGLPIWSTGRSALVGKWSERFTLAPMIGAVLLIVVLLDWFIDDRRKKGIILAGVLALSLAFQMQATHRFANDWKIQREYYWQIAWRIPDVKPNTAFLSGNVPSSNSSHHSATFALIILYGGDVLTTTAPVWYLRPLDIGEIFDERKSDQIISNEIRNIVFDGNSSNLIGILNRPTSGCLLIMDSDYLGNPLLDPSNQNILSLSNLDRIDLFAEPIVPDKWIFGEEPAHTWCYYFQKADLARQKKDWVEIIRLMDEAVNSGSTAEYSAEYLPLLEAQYNLADWSGYLETSRIILSRNTGFENFICTQWERIEDSTGITPPEDLEIKLKSILDCSQSQ